MVSRFATAYLAFEKAPQRRLLAKVGACGMAGQVDNCIANWLSDRKQWALNVRMSSWEDGQCLEKVYTPFQNNHLFLPYGLELNCIK